MNRLLVAVFLALGCVSPVDLTGADCVTTCGLRLYAVGRGVPAAETADCAGLERAERLALVAFERNVSGWDQATTCATLDSWRVYTVDTELDEYGAYYDRYGRHIAGQTFCGAGVIEINTQDWTGNSSLVHEMAHAIERCIDGEHASWGPRGIYAAINEARVAAWDEANPPMAVAP